jgi:hypothetical protein
MSVKYKVHTTKKRAGNGARSGRWFLGILILCVYYHCFFCFFCRFKRCTVMNCYDTHGSDGIY